jgi:hypothetical protein
MNKSWFKNFVRRFFMDDRVWQILGFSNIDKRGIKIIPIVGFIDSSGGTWQVGGSQGAKAPCGCQLESGGNAFRNYFYCEKHLECGVLIYQFSEGKWYWTDGKLLEVKR